MDSRQSRRKLEFVRPVSDAGKDLHGTKKMSSQLAATRKGKILGTQQHTISYVVCYRGMALIIVGFLIQLCILQRCACLFHCSTNHRGEVGSRRDGCLLAESMINRKGYIAAIQ